MELAGCIFKFPQTHHKWMSMIDLQQTHLERLHLCNMHKQFAEFLIQKQRLEFNKQKQMSVSSFINYCQNMSKYTEERIQYVKMLEHMTCDDLKHNYP
jgi:hypothetical protein